MLQCAQLCPLQVQSLLQTKTNQPELVNSSPFHPPAFVDLISTSFHQGSLGSFSVTSLVASLPTAPLSLFAPPGNAAHAHNALLVSLTPAIKLQLPFTAPLLTAALPNSCGWSLLAWFRYPPAQTQPQ
jgi:hypothetical protein